MGEGNRSQIGIAGFLKHFFFCFYDFSCRLIRAEGYLPNEFGPRFSIFIKRPIPTKSLRFYPATLTLWLDIPIIAMLLLKYFLLFFMFIKKNCNFIILRNILVFRGFLEILWVFIIFELSKFSKSYEFFSKKLWVFIIFFKKNYEFLSYFSRKLWLFIGFSKIYDFYRIFQKIKSFYWIFQNILPNFSKNFKFLSNFSNILSDFTKNYEYEDF